VFKRKVIQSKTCINTPVFVDIIVNDFSLYVVIFMDNSLGNGVVCSMMSLLNGCIYKLV